MNNTPLRKERNMGIELLRMLSMLMVVILHCVGHGELLSSVPKGSGSQLAVYILDIACIGAVDLYAIISGYVCAKSKHHPARIMELWLEVVFYSAGITIVADIINRANGIDIPELIVSFFPVIHKQYWYFSSYFCLFFFIPFINLLIEKMTKQQHRKLLVTCGILFCIISILSNPIASDIFNVNKGYSFLWLAVMYTVGAYIKLYPEDFKKIRHSLYLVIYFACVLVTYLSFPIIMLITNKIFGEERYVWLLFQYTGPFVVIGSVCLFMFFLNIKKIHCKKVIGQMASVSFGVYLISEQPYIRDNFIAGHFKQFAGKPWYELIGIVVGSAIAIYLTCTVIDLIRKGLFNLLHIRKLCDKIENKLAKSKLISTEKEKIEQTS